MRMSLQDYLFVTPRCPPYLLVVISSCFIVTARRRHHHHNPFENDDDVDDDLDHLYSDEDDPPPVPSRYISLKGEVRKILALTAAIEHRDKNMICSPLSALLPLGKLAIGAKHETLDELMDVIGVSRKRKLKSHFKHIIEDLEYLHGVELDMASRIYLSKDKHLHKKFLNSAVFIFGSTAEKVDFGNPREAADEINNWVLKKTNGMIRDFMSPSQISPSSSLVLVNAIYFAGRWKEPFDKVKPGVFYTPNGEKQVTMMHKVSWFNYHRSKTLGAQLIELPYAGDGASFIILLPSKRNGLPALLTQLKLAPDLLDTELSKMSKLKIALTMPKFKIESRLDLTHLYKKIGVKTIFDSKNSGLKDIVKDETVFVSEATQKAVIEVSEIGTEAAAATAAAINKLSIETTLFKLEANQPFLFYLIMQKNSFSLGPW